MPAPAGQRGGPQEAALLTPRVPGELCEDDGQQRGVWSNRIDQGWGPFSCQGPLDLYDITRRPYTMSHSHMSLLYPVKPFINAP